MPPARFAEIEGLRGYLALWVAISHALMFCGYSEGGRLQGLLSSGNQAVWVFIIISGFVITHLVKTRHESYAVYIGRRFLRIFPIYVICCAAYLALLGPLEHFAMSVDFGEAWRQNFRDAALSINASLREYPVAHAAAHLTMLHGLIPNNLLPYAAVSILGPAWSVSLEWQFYLLAPLVLTDLRSGPRAVAIIVGTLLVSLFFMHRWSGDYTFASALPLASGLFAVGIICRLAYEPLRARRLSPLIGACVCVLVTAFFARNVVTPMLWGVFYAYLLWSDAAPITGPVFKILFDSPVARYIGRISYSIYLSHILVLIVAADVTVRLVTMPSRAVMLAAVTAGLLLVFPISALLYALIEKPGIALGHRWAEKRARNDLQ